MSQESSKSDGARPPVYAERMFPAPVDPALAREDRSVSTVVSGVDTAELGGWEGQRWYEGGGRIGEKAVERIVVYPPTRGVLTQGDPFEPVRIGFLIDIDLGQLLADCIDPFILAIEDALNEGVFERPIELYTVDARGLPRENFRKLITGYQRLVNDGCVVVIGPMIADNSETLAPYVNAAEVPVLLWTGTTLAFGEYVFTVANGDIPTESVICANWCAQQGHRKVGFFWERSSAGDVYAGYFRRTALQLGLEITKEVVIDPNPKDLAQHLAAMRDLGTEAVVHVGYGYSTIHYAKAFREVDWDPPRIMNTAFMFYSNSNEWAAGLEGWHGIDQLGEDGANPNYEALRRRFEARFGRATRNVVVALAYDTARVAVQGIANARIPTPRHVKEGLEMIKWMPCTNGGPSCYITFAEYDHRGYKGDFLTIRELRGGDVHFRGYYRPQWPSNHLMSASG
jgi:branched-chain amino acid transport system substrate-binding protein